MSVVVPCYRVSRYLPEALNSIRAQGDVVREILLVDDGSPEPIGPHAGIMPIRHEANLGPGAARNTGVRAASGEFLAFLDADDLWTPGALVRALTRFDAEPALETVFGHAAQFLSPDAADGVRYHVETEPKPGYLVSAMVIRREAFARLGEFPTDVRTGEFVKWLSNARDQGLREGLIEETSLLRRIHGDNLTLREQAGLAGDFLKIAAERMRKRMEAAKRD